MQLFINGGNRLLYVSDYPYLIHNPHSSGIAVYFSIFASEKYMKDVTFLDFHNKSHYQNSLP